MNIERKDKLAEMYKKLRSGDLSCEAIDPELLVLLFSELLMTTNIGEEVNP